ncbi:MAG TPA: AraC family transcriptional regulator [Reyranella sp.]|jgi:AraC-like DNA-binding protein|nr:AraC family transcriptional regulator [Reyranella sp.]
MTATPPSFADRPPGTDVLADMLRAVRLTGAVFLKANFTEPFGILSPQRYDPSIPMAHLRHVSIFHYVASGGCMMETAGGSRRELKAGDLVLLPFAAEHKLWRGNAEFVPASSIVTRDTKEGVWSFSHGGGGTETRFVCGFLESAEMMFAPMFRSLPEMLIDRADDEAVGSGIAHTIDELLAKVDALTPGAEVILGRMMELLFVDLLRRHASRLPEGSRGLLAALNDPLVGRALQLMQADPARRWTTDELAREVGASRTVLGERFNAVLGKPPIEYLTGWRIQLAADRLRNGRDAIARIAVDSGYESEAAFNRAFKRVTGLTPGRWREGDGDSPPLMPLQFGRSPFSGA